jgi:hypothetical protein
MNIKQTRKSRRKLEVGDVFSFQIENDGFHWGQIVSVTANVGGFENCILIYLYKIKTKTLDNLPILKVSDLLLPPIATNELPWKKGYFVFVKNRVLKPEDLLPVHCFKSIARGTYFDDHGTPLKKAHEPCGINGLDSYSSIDDKVSEVLGIKLAPS